MGASIHGDRGGSGDNCSRRTRGQRLVVSGVLWLVPVGARERPEVHALELAAEVAAAVGGLVFGDPDQQQRETVNDTTATSGSAVG